MTLFYLQKIRTDKSFIFSNLRRRKRALKWCATQQTCRSYGTNNMYTKHLRSGKTLYKLLSIFCPYPSQNSKGCVAIFWHPELWITWQKYSLILAKTMQENNLAVQFVIKSTTIIPYCTGWWRWTWEDTGTPRSLRGSGSTDSSISSRTSRTSLTLLVISHT